MVVVYSATEGLAAMTLAIAHSRGWLDCEERVCTYWPEFAQKRKDSQKPAWEPGTRQAITPSPLACTKASCCGS